MLSEVVLRDAPRDPENPDVILISTGTEVHICATAASMLEVEGIRTRVVSMRCPEHFAAGFGASAPAGMLYKHFGFTPENVAETARAVIERARR